MNLLPTPELDELRAAVRALVAEWSGSAQVRSAASSATGYDADLWRCLGRDLAVLGPTVPDALGGSGGGHGARAVVAEELGRALVPSPFLGSAVLAVDTLMALGDDTAGKQLLPALASGELLATVAVAEDGRSLLGIDDGDLVTTATRHRDGRWVLDGTKSPVVDGDNAELLVIYAGSDDGPGFFQVDANADGVVRTPLDTLDLTRRMTRLDLAGVEAVRLDGDAVRALAQVADTAAVAVGAEQVGGMARVLELTLEQVQTRVRFGGADGSYQAVKHGCADMYCANELATSLLRYACWAADHEPPELTRAALSLHAYAGPAFYQAARSMIQYYGGIGYTWEHDAHLFYRRAKSDELLFGGPVRARAALATVLGI